MYMHTHMHIHMHMHMHMHSAACACASGEALGAGEKGLRFVERMLDAQPGLWARPSVSWFSSHSYPFR